MTLFNDKYRIESARMPGWDYASPGYYFVTIITKDREPVFGKIVDGVMTLSPIGEIARRYWSEIPMHFPNVAIDEFVIMPDHMHGIIVIRPSHSDTDNPVETLPDDNADIPVETLQCNVFTDADIHTDANDDTDATDATDADDDIHADGDTDTPVETLQQRLYR